MTEDVDHTVTVVAVEVATDRDDREDEEGGDERQVGRQLESETIRIVGDQIFLKEQLDAVGQALENAPPASRVRLRR